jgi:uncharacterized membrane protein
MDYLTVKWLHVLSSTVLFGTGLGTAYYMFFASLSRDARAAAVVLRHGVRADWVFTGTTVVFQPLSGGYLMALGSLPLQTPWIFWSIVLYLVAGACWLPVVWIQLRLRALAEQAAQAGRPLPPVYFRYLRVWTALGVPAFAALVVVFYLMVAKPS